MRGLWRLGRHSRGLCSSEESLRRARKARERLRLGRGCQWWIAQWSVERGLGGSEVYTHRPYKVYRVGRCCNNTTV
jgi:hypothetical protein